MQPPGAIAQREVHADGERPAEEFFAGRKVPRSAPAETRRESRPARSGARAAWELFRACRPGQWLENVVVLLAPAAVGAFLRPGAAASVWTTVAAFCLLS
ncbi:MAG: hypothetical protein ACTHQQ_20430, partial [Solirubrobacteraceae bacterium]